MSPLTIKNSKSRLTVDIRDLSDDLCNSFSADELRVLYRSFIEEKPPIRKQDLSDGVASFLFGPEIKSVFDGLEPLEKLAVAEALYSPSGYDPEPFQAKHGGLVSMGRFSSARSSPKYIRLFLVERTERTYKARRALKAELLKFVPKPAQPKLETTAELPPTIELKRKRYQWQDDDAGRLVTRRKQAFLMPTQKPKEITETESINIETASREDAAQSELWSVLRLIQEGKVSVAEKSRQPSPDVMWAVSRCLGGDFYQERELEEFKEIGYIRSFAWTMLIQHSLLAVAKGKKLGLSAAGLAAFSTEPAILIKSLWENWLQNSSFDEFNRVDSIKGQGGKAKLSMTSVARRRETIVKTLVDCPADVWIRFDEFSRFMRATGNIFEVTFNAWQLYILDPEYGALGYSNAWKWEILQDRYMLCFLFEYAATLGLIDVAFVDPAEVRQGEVSSLWGSDSLRSLSRYDGLLYFRINALGQYCLGKSPAYAKVRSGVPAVLSVMPNLHVRLTQGKLSMSDSLTLESFANQLDAGVWELSQEKTLEACENGQQIEVLQDLLGRLDDQPLPQQVERFLSKMKKQADAVQWIGTGVLFHCRDASVAAEIASHPMMKNLCQLTNRNQIVVKSSEESKFRKNLHLIGFGTASGTLR